MNENKEYLKSELKRWIQNHNGKTPTKNCLKTQDGYPSFNQFKKIFNTGKWNEILGLCCVHPNNLMWTEYEDCYIKRNFALKSDEEMADDLNRTKNGVSYRRKYLGLLRQSKKQPWEEWEKQFLKENFYDADQDDICSVLSHREWETIRAYSPVT